MSEIRLRLATLEDLAILREFEQQIIKEEQPYNDVIKSSGASYYDLAKLINDKHACVQVAVSGDRIVASGYAQIRPSKQAFTHDHHGYLGFMYVLPEFRGRRINKMIVDFLINWCKGRGVNHIYLDVYALNAPAIRAYEKAGFTSSLVEMKLNVQ